MDVECKWCGGRGCIYCPQHDEEAERIVAELEARIGAGEIHVVAVRESRTLDFVLRRPPVARTEAAPCLEHLWKFDAADFKRRYCARLGCSARQVWRWLPASDQAQGEWVDEAAAISGAPIGRTVGRVKRKVNQKPKRKAL